MNIDPVELKPTPDYHAPDSSEIYLLAKGRQGSLCQCVLPIGSVSLPISHKSVEEIWYFLEGEGEVWRKGYRNGHPVMVRTGTSLVVPVRTAFQFRNIGSVPLKFAIVTMPSWPGPEEAIKEEGVW